MKNDPWSEFQDTSPTPISDPWADFRDYDPNIEMEFGDSVLRVLPRSIERGFRGSQNALTNIESDIGLENANQAAADIAANQRRIAEIPADEDVQRAFKDIQNQEGFWNTAKSIAGHPEILPDVLGESFGAFAPVLAAGLGAQRKAALAGITGLGSFGISYGQKILEAMDRAGVDTTDPKQIEEALNNSPFMDAARKDAALYSGPVALFDAASGGFAGKLVHGASGVGSTISRGTGELGIQAGLGMLGEGSGQLASEGRISSPSDVLLEGIAELPIGLGEIGIGAGIESRRSRNIPSPEIGRTDFSSEMDRIVTPPQSPPPSPPPSDSIVTVSSSQPNISDSEILDILDTDTPIEDIVKQYDQGAIPSTPEEEPLLPVDLDQLDSDSLPQANDIGLEEILSGNAPMIQDSAPQADITSQIEEPAIIEAASKIPDALSVSTPQTPIIAESDNDILLAGSHAASSPFNELQEPSQAQKEAGNYKKGHVKVQGLDISIETPRGGERRGVDASGKPWAVQMQNDYGYIKRTEGADGEHLDVFLGNNPKSPRVYVIDQVDLDTGKFDEHKAMIGFNSQDEAIQAYIQAFTDGRGTARIGSAPKAVPMTQFKKWVRSGDTKKPLGTLNRVQKGIKKQFKQEKPRIKSLDLLRFLAKNGGIRDEAGELRQLGLQRFVPGAGQLVRPTGKQLDYAREAAVEAGYGNWQTVSDFLNALDDIARGKKIYKPEDSAVIADGENAKNFDSDVKQYQIENHYLSLAEKYGISTQGKDLDDIIAEVNEREAIITDGVESDQVAESQESDIDIYISDKFSKTATDLKNAGVLIDEDIPFGDEINDSTRETNAQPEAAGDYQESVSGGGVSRGQEETVQYRPSAASRGETPNEGPPILSTEQTEAGTQTVIPGAEEISDRALAERKMKEKLRPVTPQRPTDDGIFDTGARRQADFLDLEPIGAQESENGQRRSRSEDLSQHSPSLNEKIEAGPGTIPDFSGDISERLAISSFNNTSHHPERVGKRWISDYNATLQEDYKELRALAEREGKLEVFDEDFERYRQGYKKRTEDYLSSHSNVASSFIVGPARFPVARMQKRSEWAQNKLNLREDFRRKALKSIRGKMFPYGEGDRIVAEDPEAVQKIKDKISSLRALQERMKEGNKIIKSGNNVRERLSSLKFSDETINNATRKDFAGRVGFADFALSNNLANIKRLEGRLKELEAKQARKEAGAEKQQSFKGGRIEENIEDNRLRIFFDEIPSQELRAKLKSNGFRWSPSNKAWQRQNTPQALSAAKRILDLPESSPLAAGTTSNVSGESSTLTPKAIDETLEPTSKVNLPDPGKLTPEALYRTQRKIEREFSADNSKPESERMSEEKFSSLEDYARRLEKEIETRGKSAVIQKLKRNADTSFYRQEKVENGQEEDGLIQGRGYRYRPKKVFFGKEIDALFTIEDTIRRIFGKNISLRYSDVLLDENGKGVEGAFTVEDIGFTIAIALSEGKDLTNLIKTTGHELIHALRRAGVFSKSEWNHLRYMARHQWIENYNIESRYRGEFERYRKKDGTRLTPEEIQSKLEEEAIAEAFGDYLAYGRIAFPEKSRTIFSKIKAFLSALRDALNKKFGWQNVDDIFEKTNRGGRAGGGFVEKGEGIFSFQRPDKPNDFQNFRLPDQGVFDILADRNRNMLRRISGAATPRALKVSWDEFRRYMQDRFIGFRRIQHGVEVATGERIAENSNIIRAEETFSGRAGYKLDKLYEKHFKPIFEKISTLEKKIDGDALARVDEFLYALHAPERNAQIKKIAKEGSKFADVPQNLLDAEKEGVPGSGMSDADAAAIIERAKKDGIYEELKEISDIARTVMDQSLDERVRMMLIKPESAKAMRDAYKSYFPLRGQTELGIEGEVRPGKGFSIRGEEFKRAAGRQSLANDLLANIMAIAEESIIRGEKNRVSLALYNLAIGNPNPSLWEVRRKKQVYRLNENTGVMEWAPESPPKGYKKDDNTVFAKVSGEEVQIELKDKRLAEAMKNLNAMQGGALIKMLMSLNHYLSLTHTMLNPEFVITNAFRDIQTALINSQAYNVEDIAKHTARDYFKALNAVWRGLNWNEKESGSFAVGKLRPFKDKAESKEWLDYYHEYAAAGGKVSFWKMDDVNEKRSKIANEIGLRRDGKFNYTKRQAKAVFELIETVNTAVDNGVRLSAYVQGRRAGMSKAEAASLAKNLTVNFNRRGEYGPYINSLYLFANASTQGTAVMWAAMKHRKVQAITAGITLFGYAWSKMMAMMSPADDDDELIWDKIPDYEKEANIIVVFPDGRLGQAIKKILPWNVKDGIEYAKIPMPYGYRVFNYLGANVDNWQRGATKPWDAIGNVAKSVVNNFNPVGSDATWWNTLSPTILDPVAAISTNTNPLTGKQIYPGINQFDAAPPPDSQRYFPNVRYISKEIADTLNSFTGGDKVVPGVIDVSPETMDYIFDYFTGSAGAFAARAVDMGANLFSGKEMGINDLIFTRKVLGSTPAWADKSTAYERIHEIEAQVDRYKTYLKSSPEKASEFYQENKSVIDLYGTATTKEYASTAQGARKRLSDLRKRRVAIESSTTLPAEERKAAIEKLDEAEKTVVNAFNRAWNRSLKTTAGDTRPFATPARTQ